MRSARLVAAGLALLTPAALAGSAPPAPAAPATPGALAEIRDQPLVAGRQGGTFRLVSAEPSAIDPASASDPAGFQIAAYLFTGLVTVAADGSVTPGVATTWRPGPDCTQWTFELRRGTRFHNREEVTSASFKRSWERVLSAGTKAPYHYLLEPVRQIDATNPYLLAVTLDRPDCEFVLRMVQPVFSPVPASAGPVGDWAYAEHPIGNGPFQLDGSWQHNRSIRLARFDDYAIGRKANLDAVDIALAVDPLVLAYQGFRAGTVDWAVPPDTEEDARSVQQLRGRLISKPEQATTYLRVMATTKPLDTALARKAISLAIDREAIAREMLHSGDAAAHSLTPPRFSLASAENLCDYCRFDPAQARRLAASSGLTPGTVVHFGVSDQPDSKKLTAAVKRQLETTLGLRINYYSLPARDLLADSGAYGASGIYRSAWDADYPSPGDVLTPLLATSSIGTADPTKPATGSNPGRYSNRRVDELLDLARSTRNDQRRTELYRLAEQIAIGEDLAVIPLWYEQEYRLANTIRFTNLRMDWHGNADLSVISLR